jgi:hypothetical protein
MPSRPLDVKVLRWRDVLDKIEDGRPVWLDRHGFNGEVLDDKAVLPKRHGDRVWFGVDSLPIGKPGEFLAGVRVRSGVMSILDTRPIERAYFCHFGKNSPDGANVFGQGGPIALFPERPADAGGQHVLAFTHGDYTKAHYRRVVSNSMPLPQSPDRYQFQRAIEQREGFEIMPISDPEDFNPRILKRRAQELIK